MVTVYRKWIRKSWLIGITPPLLVAIFVPMIGSIFPEYKEQAAMMMEIMQHPIYKAFLGNLIGDIGTWPGMYYMYIFSILEMIIVFIAIFIPAKYIANEIDKKTLDVTLSYPISRSRFLLERFGVYLSYNLLYPILMLGITYPVTTSINEELDFLALTYSLVGVWFLLFALGALSLLCGTIFLESNKALAASGAVILAQFIFVRIGGISESLQFFKTLSLFNYLSSTTIRELGSLPLGELVLVAGVGLIALLGALYIFEKRELAY